MHPYIEDAKRMVEDIENKKEHRRRNVGRMHLQSSNVRLAILPTWYTRVQRRVRNNALRRLMLRAGIARHTKTCYIMARAMLMEFLENTIQASAELAEYRRRKTVTLRDVKKVLKMKYGMRIYS